MYRSSYLDGLWDERQVVLQLLFRKLLLPGFVENLHVAFLCFFPFNIFSERFVRVQVVHPYRSIDTAWKKFSFISLERSDFYMIHNLVISSPHFLYAYIAAEVS